MDKVPCARVNFEDFLFYYFIEYILYYILLNLNLFILSLSLSVCLICFVNLEYVESQNIIILSEFYTKSS